MEAAQASKEILTDMFGEIALCKQAEISSYPVAPDAEHRLDAMLHDLRALDYVRRQKEDAQAKRGFAEKSVIELGDKIFGKGNALEAYENTRQVVRNIAEGSPTPPFLLSIFLGQQASSQKSSSKDLGFDSEEQMCDAWLRRCKALFLADQEFQRWKETYDTDGAKYKEIYAPDFTTPDDFEIALATFENYNILQSEGHEIPYWEQMVSAYELVLRSAVTDDMRGPS